MTPHIINENPHWLWLRVGWHLWFISGHGSQEDGQGERSPENSEVLQRGKLNREIQMGRSLKLKDFWFIDNFSVKPAVHPGLYKQISFYLWLWIFYICIMTFLCCHYKLDRYCITELKFCSLQLKVFQACWRWETLKRQTDRDIYMMLELKFLIFPPYPLNSGSAGGFLNCCLWNCLAV